MPQIEAANFFILDSHQGLDAADGWRLDQLTNLRIASQGLQLIHQPAPPQPLKDTAGAFGGLENPTGVAVSPDDGALYVADASRHLICKVSRREGLQSEAHYYRLDGGPHASDIFVYVPTANRVELWPRVPGAAEPQSLSEVIIICETAWNEADARRAVLAYANAPVCCAECASHEGASNGSKQSAGCGCGGSRSQQQKHEGLKSPKKNNNCACDSVGQPCECEGPTQDQKLGIEKEWNALYPSSLPAGEICKTSIEYLTCLGGQGSEPNQFNEPRGLAVSPAGNLYVADSLNHRVQVFALGGLALKAIWGKRAGLADVDAQLAQGDCAPSPEQTIRLGQPIAGDAPGQFNEPWDVASDSSGNIYVADKGNHRVQKYNCRARRFELIDGTKLAAHFFQVLYGPTTRERFVYVPARQRLELWPHALDHDPATIDEATILSTNVLTSDEARTLVLNIINAVGASDILVEWQAAYPPSLAAFPQPEAPFSSPTHLAIDASNRLYVVDADNSYVKFLDQHGRVLGRAEFVDEVRANFKPTAIALDAGGKLVLAVDGGAHRFRVDGEHAYYDDFYSSWRGRCAGLATDAEGRLFAIGADDKLALMTPPKAYVRQGSCISLPLDSGVENCQWHKLTLETTDIPAGTSINFKTYTSPDALTLAEIQALNDDEWLTNQTNAQDFLVQSRPGRYLWLKIEMRGNGIETPNVPGLKVHFPRRGYLQFLPAIYQADPVSRDFLDRFLSIFENIFGGIQETIENISQLFDPNAVPAGEAHDFLSWLAGWLDMLFDASWSTETRRSLLRHAPELYRKRGTPAGLKLLLKLALGIEVQILEHYQLRRWLFLSAQSPLGDRSQLWGNCIVNRLQLDENAIVGGSGLIYTPDPLRDPFFVYAHKFSVFARAAEVSHESIERMMRYLIEQEKPAHTKFDVVKVEPRFRVGVQSTIGLDAQVGAYPRTVLGHCATLGYDTLLGCDESEPKHTGVMGVGTGARVGASFRVG